MGHRSLTDGLEGASPAGPPPALRDALAIETGSPLPNATKWSRRLGSDVSGARLVTGPQAAAATTSIGVPAFTVGNRVFFGDGASATDEEILQHELTHVAQQRGATMPPAGELKITSPDDHVEQEARGTGADAPPEAELGRTTEGPQITATGEAVIAPLPIMGPGNVWGLPGGQRSPQIDAFKYFEQHGRTHFKQLADLKLGTMTLQTGSPYAEWQHGDSHTFVEKLADELYRRLSGRAWDLAEKTLAPTSLWKLIDTGRDADNADDPAQANEYHLGVTLELQKAYRERIRDSLDRLMPRFVQEWNRRTVADHAELSKRTSIPIKEAPEANQPGVGLLQSHPIDPLVLSALYAPITPMIKPDFAAFRKDFPAEAKPNGPRQGALPTDKLRKVKFEWQSSNRARHWIKVTDPIDATPEEVAQEMFGDTHLTYLITPASPLFGFDNTRHQLRPEYATQYGKFYDDKSPSGDTAHEIIAGPQGEDAALDQAAGFKAAKASKPAVLQTLDIVISRLKAAATSALAWVTFDKGVEEAVARAEQRKQKLADATDPKEVEKWTAQAREQLDIADKSANGLDILEKLFRSFEAVEPRNLAHEIGTLFVKAAGHSDLVVTARQELEHANQRLLAFPADWIEAQFRWIRRAILASQKDARTGQENDFVKQLGQKEERLRLELMKIRDKLLTRPLEVKDDVERITKQLQELATGAAAARNIDLCDEAFVQLKDAKSGTGWLRSLVSNPVTGDHGNDRLDALAARADQFQLEWNLILLKWRLGDQQGAAAALQQKAETQEWKQFFNDVAKEIKDQAKYDAWMTFAILVGIAIATGFAGALLEPLAAAALGPVLGFLVTVTTEAALFTTMSYFLVERHPSLQGFKHELGKNVIVFGVLKGLSKAFAGLEKVLEVELKEAEVIAQFATLNGMALHDANQEKAKRGETLTEAEILKISFDNLVFMLAVAVGGKALAPMFGRWRVKTEVGRGLREIEALHKQVTGLADAVKATKDRAAAEQLLQKQRELLTAEREFLEGLLELAKRGRDHALKKGMTAEQYDALMGAQKDLASATRGLREAELMGKLEPIVKGEYLVERGATFDEARDHYAGDKANKVTETIDASGARSVEVILPDGSRMRISERMGKPGEVSTATKPIETAAGEPPPPRAEEVAKAHGVSDPASLQAFEALYKAHPKEVLALLDALKSEPGLANRLLAQFGEQAMKHFKPTREGVVDIHGEIEISANKLESFSNADLVKLVETARNKGPISAFEYFESTSTKGKPGSRLRFKSRLQERADNVSAKILESIGMDRSDPRADIFDNMTQGEAVRLWDLFHERAYTSPGIRQQAAAWAFSKRPANVRDLVAEMQFYEFEIANRGEQILTEAKAELQSQLSKRAAAKGSALTPAETTQVIKDVSTTKLGRTLDKEGPAWGDQAVVKATQELGQAKKGADGKPTTVGAEAADVAWQTNVAAQHGAHASGPRNIGKVSDAELPARVQSVADTLSFGSNADGAYHAHKHRKELASRPPPETEMVAYLNAARTHIRSNTGVRRPNSDGSRSVIFEGNGMRAIVHVSADGNAVIATFSKAGK